MDVEGVGMDLAETEEELRCRREGVGWVDPVIWCVGLGSEISTGRREAEVEVLDWEVFDATDAVCARRAVSSRVRRLTYIAISVSCPDENDMGDAYHGFLLFLTLGVQFRGGQRPRVSQWSIVFVTRRYSMRHRNSFRAAVVRSCGRCRHCRRAHDL
jgi:hypothetical protein